jgi:hypothetical protein
VNGEIAELRSAIKVQSGVKKAHSRMRAPFLRRWGIIEELELMGFMPGQTN